MAGPGKDTEADCAKAMPFRLMIGTFLGKSAALSCTQFQIGFIAG